MNRNPLMMVSCEIRFDSDLSESEVCNRLKSCIEKKCSLKQQFVKQGVMELPEKIREQSGPLKYAPHFLVEDGAEIFGVGPHVLLIETELYQGFEKFASFVKKAIDALDECDFRRINQIRLIYVNRIDDPIADATNLHIAIDGTDLKSVDDFTFHIEYVMSSVCRVALRVCNNNAYIPGNDEDASFSVVDLRAKYDMGGSFDIYDKLIESHDFVKTIFTKVINKEYMKKKWGINVL